MKQDRVLLLLLVGIMFLVPSCIFEPGLDKAKFSELNGAALDLKAAIEKGTACDMPDSVLKRLTIGTESLKDKVKSKEEQDLLGAYSHLLITYKDGLLLCQSRTLLSEFQFVPKGRIYVSQEVDPLIEKYGFSIEKHLYRPTGMYWKSISADSINVIWENAQIEIKLIENIINYH